MTGSTATLMSTRGGDAPASLDVRLGECVAVDFHGCTRALLADQRAVEQAMLGAARASGATIVGSHFHTFSPQGVSGVVVITESHFAVHTWPEVGFAAVDLFTCGPSVDIDVAIGSLHAAFASTTPAVVQRLARGTDPQRRGDTRAAAATSASSWRDKFERERPGNMVAVIELSGCAAVHTRLAAWLQRIPGLLGASTTAPCAWLPGQHHFAVTSDAFSVVGRISADDTRVYLTAMAPSFFEPRLLAEDGLRVLEGSGYGLHVSMQP